jgi:predicted transposase YdaD
MAAALMSKMRISPQDRPTVKAQCLRLLVTLKLDPAKMQLISGFIDTYLQLDSQEEAIFQSELGTMEPREQEQIMQITTSWQEQGRVEGKLEGQSSTILRQLSRKLGNLPEEISTQIKSLEQSQLNVLAEDLLDFETFDDLNQWLNNL